MIGHSPAAGTQLPPLALHHIGLTTPDFAAPLRLYADLGYQCVAEAVDSAQGVELRLLEAHSAAPRVELIRPLSHPSPVSRYLQRIGPCIYHCCYETSDLAATVARLGEYQRLICVADPVPAPLFGNRCVSFWHIAGVGLVEFLELSPTGLTPGLSTAATRRDAATSHPPGAASPRNAVPRRLGER